MANDPRVDLAITLRGGYGWTRLLPRIDFRCWPRANKQWMGYSDFTAFQLAALAHAGMMTFAGPVVAGDFGAPVPSAFTLRSLLRPARPAAVRGDVHARRTRRGHARERCGAATWRWSSIFSARRIFRGVDGGILFLEDVGETPYRIERMLYQLHHAGILARQRAILLGQFTEYALSDNDGGYDLDTRGRADAPRVRECRS